MPRAKARRLPFGNVGELLEHLGGIPAARVRLHPAPGTATKRDLLQLHARDGKLYELVNRTLVEKPMGETEAYIALELGRVVANFVVEHDLGFYSGADSLIEFLPKLVRGPDLCFVSWAKRPERNVPRAAIGQLIPDLVVEVLSSSNTRAEIARKIKEYFLAGVELVWVIDPAHNSADVYTAPGERTALDETGTLDGGDVLPGFTLPLAKLFARLAPPAPKKRKK